MSEPKMPDTYIPLDVPERCAGCPRVQNLDDILRRAGQVVKAVSSDVMGGRMTQ